MKGTLSKYAPTPKVWNSSAATAVHIASEKAAAATSKKTAKKLLQTGGELQKFAADAARTVVLRNNRPRKPEYFKTDKPVLQLPDDAKDAEGNPMFKTDPAPDEIAGVRRKLGGVKKYVTGGPEIELPDVSQGTTPGAPLTGGEGLTGNQMAAIGTAAGIAGQITESATDDGSDRRFTKKEAAGNTAGEMLKGAGSMAGLGFTIGGPVGAAIGGVVGAGVGAWKASRENKASKETANALQAESAARHNRFRQQYLDSRLTGMQTGFGFNTSTNMNMQSTRLEKGGARPLPGGTMEHIGDGAVQFKGKTHEEGGIMLDPNTEVEHKETMDKVTMSDGQEADYFFSEHLKLNGKSYAERHKEIVKSKLPKAEKEIRIQQLAKLQERAAAKSGEKDRGPGLIARYGGPKQYQTAGVKVDQLGQFQHTAQTPGMLSYTPQANAEHEYWQGANYDAKWIPLVNQSLADDGAVMEAVTRMRAYTGVDAAEQKAIAARLDKAGGDVKKLREILIAEGTDKQIGPFHRALLAGITPDPSPVVPATTPTPAADGKTEPEPTPLSDKRQPCPEGHYVDPMTGECTPLPGDAPMVKTPSSLVPGLLQLVPPAYAFMNPYRRDAGMMGTPGIRGPLMPRVNMNAERAAVQASEAAFNEATDNMAGPQSMALKLASRSKTAEQLLRVSNAEQEANKALAAEEAKLGLQSGMFNAEQEANVQRVNMAARIQEKQYAREEKLGALDAAVSRIAGIVKDDRSFKSQERLASALDQTGAYETFKIEEALLKEAKRKKSQYYGMTKAQIRAVAAAYKKQLYGDPNIVMPEEKKEKKTGGARKYISSPELLTTKKS